MVLLLHTESPFLGSVMHKMLFGHLFIVFYLKLIWQLFWNTFSQRSLRRVEEMTYWELFLSQKRIESISNCQEKEWIASSSCRNDLLFDSQNETGCSQFNSKISSHKERTNRTSAKEAARKCICCWNWYVLCVIWASILLKVKKQTTTTDKKHHNQTAHRKFFFTLNS